MSEHKANVQEVLWDSKLTDFFCPSNKCKFLSLLNTSDICCHQRPHHGAIQSPDYPGWPKPWKSKTFNLSLFWPTFYWWFIYGYPKSLCHSHTSLKGYYLQLTDECRLAFEALKKVLRPCQSHQLDPRHPDHSWNWCLQLALAAVLSIHNLDGELPPHCIPFWTFLALELNYDVHDKSYWQFLKPSKTMVALSRRLYTPLNIVTNHQHLQYFSTTRSSCGVRIWSKYNLSF